MRALPGRKVVRRVRLHQDGSRPSIEGLWMGSRDGHYVIGRPKVLESASRTIALEAETVWIPQSRVVFIEVWEGREP